MRRKSVIFAGKRKKSIGHMKTREVKKQEVGSELAGVRRQG